MTWETFVLPFLRALMLITDGAGIFISFTLARYYKPALWGRGSPVFLIHVFFAVLTVVFVALTISDALVIMGAPQSWATLPIVRGLTFRLPLIIVGCWMIHRQHAR